jgi:hypothetical protein
LAFNFDPALFNAEHSAPYQLLIGDRPLRENLDAGIQRIFLSPEEVGVPVSHLQLYSPLSGSPLWFDPGFVLIPEDSNFTIDIGGAQDWAFIQKGFFDRERYDNVLPVRWTGGSARLLIPVFPAVCSGWTVEFKVVMTGPPRPGPLTEMKVYLDGKEAGTIALADSEGLYRLPLPEINLAAPALLPLDLQLPTWRPDQALGVPDRRQLGVMLDWIRIERSDR